MSGWRDARDNFAASVYTEDKNEEKCWVRWDMEGTGTGHDTIWPFPGAGRGNWPVATGCVMTSSMRRKGAVVEVEVVSSRSSQALLSIRSEGMCFSLRACWRRATVQSLIEVGDGARILRLAALWPWVGRREAGQSEVRYPGDWL